MISKDEGSITTEPKPFNHFLSRKLAPCPTLAERVTNVCLSLQVLWVFSDSRASGQCPSQLWGSGLFLSSSVLQEGSTKRWKAGLEGPSLLGDKLNVYNPLSGCLLHPREWEPGPPGAFLGPSCPTWTHRSRQNYFGTTHLRAACLTWPLHRSCSPEIKSHLSPSKTVEGKHVLGVGRPGFATSENWLPTEEL